MLKTYDIPLDLEKVLYTPSTLLFNVSRNDFDSVQLNFKIISQDDLPVDLTNTTVELAIKKPSGLTVYQQAEITNAIEGEAKILLSIQAYVEYGVHTAEVYIRSGENLAVTSPFYYASRAAIMESDIESVNDWTALHYALFAFDLKPIITDGFPADTPQYVGQMAFDALYKKTYVATDLSPTAWEPIGTGEGGGGGLAVDLGAAPPTHTPRQIGEIFIDTVEPAGYISLGAGADSWKRIDNEDGTLTNITWNDILDKPLTFAPDLHTHEIGEITGLDAQLTAINTEIDTKADINHNHDTEYSNINHNHDLQYSPIVHDHGINEITGLQAALDSKQDIGAGGGTLEPHTHEITDITGLRAELDTKANNADVIADFTELNNTKANKTDVYTKLETYNKGEVDTIVTGITQGGGTIVENNLLSTSTTNALAAIQGRILNETKADINHNHDDTYSPTNHNHDLLYSPINHNHEIAEITGLQAEITAINTAIDTKADINHNHDLLYSPINHNHDAEYSDINHNHDLLYSPINHNHEIAEITGLQAEINTINTAIDTKADINHNHDLLYSPINHTHETAEIVGLQAALDGKQDAGTIAAHVHTWEEITGKPLLFEPAAHTHTIAEIEGLQIALDGKADDADLTTKADINHSHTYEEITGKPATFTPPLSSPLIVGGARTGNGLAMAGEYMTVKSANGLRTDGATSYAVEIDRSVTDTWYASAEQMAGLSLWKGTQAEYDAITTKDPNTLYFIAG